MKFGSFNINTRVKIKSNRSNRKNQVGTVVSVTRNGWHCVKFEDKEVVCFRTSELEQYDGSLDKLFGKLEIKSDVHKPVRNYRCLNSKKKCDDNKCHENIINRCSRQITNIRLEKTIGEGAHGSVFLAVGSYGKNNISIAVKIIKDANLDEMNYEVEFSYYMDETNIGPNIYDSFFVKNDITNEYTQYILMEPFIMDGREAIRSKFSPSIKKDIIIQMINLMYGQLFEHGLECYDIKPENFVYNDKTNVVKIIDFGVDWCHSINNDNKPVKKLNIIFIIMLLQLQYFINEHTHIKFSEICTETFPLFAERFNLVNEITKELSSNEYFEQIFIFYTGISKVNKTRILKLMNSLV